MHRLILPLALVASPAVAQTNGDIQWQANQLETLVVERVCKPYYVSGQTDMLIVWVKRHLPEREQAKVATAICYAYAHGRSDSILERDREQNGNAPE